MLKLVSTGQFRKDYKRIKKRGYHIDLLEKVVDDLLNQRDLSAKHNDHALSGDWSGYRECHILPDWLLVYRINEKILILTLARTGTHSDLFNK